MKKRRISARRVVLAVIVALGALAAIELGLGLEGLRPGAGGVELAGKFFSAAARPALTYEDSSGAEASRPLLLEVLAAAWTTVMFAASAIGISIVFGLALGFLASTAWWAGDPAGAADSPVARARRWARPAVYAVTRVTIALARSVHELIWALVFLSAMGLTHLAAVVAIAIPYTGTFAKIFSEMIDETPRDASTALRAAGASPLQVFLIGLAPRAAPELTSYAIYRFECALRSSAVLGFFGIPTLGYFIRLAFENSHFGEVWTYLYALVALVIVLDWWSGALRRSMVER